MSAKNNRTSTKVSVIAMNAMQTNSNASIIRNQTVGVIIIGDEILKGHVQDTNSHFLCKRFFALGVNFKVKNIYVMSDELDIIANEVAQFSKKFTHVITSGGILSTPDDVTFEGIAQSFGQQVYPHPDLVAVCK